MSRRRPLLLLPLLLLLALAASAPPDADAAPRVGRWIGTTSNDMRLAFTVHAIPGGRRFVAGAVAWCTRDDTAMTLEEIPGSDSPAWPVDRRGRIRALEPTEPFAEPAFRGRLRATRGTIRTEFGSGECVRDDVLAPPDRGTARWVPARPVENGRYELSGPFGSSGGFTVLGGTLITNAGGVINVPKVPEPPVYLSTCTDAGDTFNDGWIEPDGSFLTAQFLNFRDAFRGGFDSATTARGTYTMDWPADTTCNNGPWPFTARLVERQPAPRAGSLVLPPAFSGGAPPAPPKGPCPRPQTVTVDPVEAISCFRDRGGLKVATAPVRVNGIEVVPARGGEVRLDPRTAHLTTTGRAEVRLPIGPYGTAQAVRIWRGDRLDWQLRAVRGFKLRSAGQKPDLGSLPAFGEQVIGGLPLKGSAELKFEPGSARGKLSVELPEYLGGITGDVALKTSNKLGLHVDELKLTFPAATLRGVELKSAALGMSRAKDGAIHWDGIATVELQRDKGVEKAVDLETLELKAELGFGPGDGYFKLGASLGGINKQVYRGVFLQRLGLVGQVKPIKFTGNIGFTAGPQIDVTDLGKLEAASIDGTYELDAGPPLCYQQTGKGKLLTAELFTTRGKLCSNGLLEGEFGLRTAPLPPFSVEARLNGWVHQDKAFNVEGTGTIGVPGIPGRGEVVASSVGLAACLQAGPSVGFSYRWRDRRVEFMSRSCGIGPWRAAKPKGARLHAVQQGFDVPPGQRVAVFSAVGAGAAPTVTLSGPRGERVGTGAVADERFRVAQHDGTTYFAVARPSPGRWTLQAEPGSAPVSAFRTAAPYPRVRIRARVRRRSGGVRLLRYRIAGLAGGRVRFVEAGPGVRRVLGTAGGTGAAARGRRAAAASALGGGSLRFRPAAGRPGSRRVLALVERDGAPAPARVVARFRVRRTDGPAPPRDVRVRRRGLRRVISWDGRGDLGYRVSVRLSDGRRLLFLPGRRHRVTVRPVLRGTRLRVSVRARDALGRLGPPRGVRSRPRRPRAPHFPDPCAARTARARC